MSWGVEDHHARVRVKRRPRQPHFHAPSQRQVRAPEGGQAVWSLNPPSPPPGIWHIFEVLDGGCHVQRHLGVVYGLVRLAIIRSAPALAKKAMRAMRATPKR